MSNQIRLYVEEQVDNDWKIAYSVVDSIEESGYSDDDARILDILRRKQAVWGVSDLMLYTENGDCVYLDGTAESNDLASDTIVKARKSGKYMSVIDSNILYTVPVDTELRFHGSRIAAVSVVQNMKTFLDDMHFSSFGGTAWMYLTGESGIVVSMLTNPSAVSAFNFRAIVEDAAIEPLNEAQPAAALLTAEESAAYLLTKDARRDYIVSVPVSTGAQPLRLFYLAPEDAVNRATNGFSQRLTTFSMLIVILFAAMVLAAFLLAYGSRKKLFDRQILARERMLDLLVKNTHTAFALFRANQPEPTYVSSNVVDIIGDSYWTIDRIDGVYRMRNGAGEETDELRQANEGLCGWDGKSEYKSGYIRNGVGVPPNYFAFELYPIDAEGMDFVGIAQDVTRTHEREEATKNAMELAMRANEAKSRFLSNMSHDIRTPMNAIMNMTNFALESIDQPKKLGPYLRTIRESSEHLLHLINDVLDMSRIESGKTVLYDAPFDLRAEMQRQADMIRPLCAARSQTFLADFSGVRTDMVCGDALKLSQIVMNLLSNAVKFTPERGAVRFTVREIPSLRSDIADIRITIEDTGIGMNAESLQRIFEPFYRAGDGDERIDRVEGSGLGLSICKSYVDAMGGTVRCESEVGEGTTFTVELFFTKHEPAAEEAPAADAPAEAMFLGLHCLVVEDNATNQIIAKALLERFGFIVDFADNGREGVKRFLNTPPDTYDVIYMDVRMPVMDGCEATVAIRESDHPRAKTVPIVAMTANVYAEDIEKARISGMDAYVGKPIVSFELAEQTNKALHAKRGQETTA